VPFTVFIVAVLFSWTWFLEPRVPAQGVIPVGAAVLALAFWHDQRHRAWGFDWRAFGPGLWRTMIMTLIAVAAIILAGAALGSLHDRRNFIGTFGPLVVWGLAQQWVLQTVVLAEAQRRFSRQAGIWIAAAIFGAIHLPNPFLATVTFVGGVLWGRLYDRYPNILPLAISHALATLAILHAFTPEMTGRLRIGLSYLRLFD
jgi:membrane protease YdiL (CAAX protease family)